jgi:hypothetical protein
VRRESAGFRAIDYALRRNGTLRRWYCRLLAFVNVCVCRNSQPRRQADAVERRQVRRLCRLLSRCSFTSLLLGLLRRVSYSLRIEILKIKRVRASHCGMFSFLQTFFL